MKDFISFVFAGSVGDGFGVKIENFKGWSRVRAVEQIIPDLSLVKFYDHSFLLFNKSKPPSGVHAFLQVEITCYKFQKYTGICMNFLFELKPVEMNNYY